MTGIDQMLAFDLAQQELHRGGKRDYTKGKWKVSYPQDNHTALIAQDLAHSQVIAGIIWGNSISEIEQRANAHLIAAAPDMYEALKDAQHWFTEAKAYIPLHNATLGAINQALAKATEGEK